jgi:hypothetical protein
MKSRYPLSERILNILSLIVSVCVIVFVIVYYIVMKSQIYYVYGVAPMAVKLHIWMLISYEVFFYTGVWLMQGHPNVYKLIVKMIMRSGTNSEVLGRRLLVMMKCYLSLLFSYLLLCSIFMLQLSLLYVVILSIVFVLCIPVLTIDFVKEEKA